MMIVGGLLLLSWNVQGVNGFIPPSRSLSYSHNSLHKQRAKIPKFSATTRTSKNMESTATSLSVVAGAVAQAAGAAGGPAAGAAASASGTTAATATAAKAARKAVLRGTKTKKTIISGKFFTVLSKFLVSPQRYVEIFKALFVHATDSWDDLADICLIGFCLKVPLPLARFMYTKRHPDLSDEQRETKFLRSKTRRIAEVIEEFGWLYTLLYVVECALFVLDELQFKFVHKYPIHQWTTWIVISLWGARNLSDLKRYALFYNVNKRNKDKTAGTRLLNRLIDILIFAGTGFVILDFLSVQIGFALKSIFGLSSFATLVFSLASKELAQEFLASLAIQGTNMYTEGEKILLNDGTTGLVQKLGWLNTHIRRSDELVVRIPNTQISRSRFSNISRTRLSAVQQSIVVPLDSIDKVSQFTEDIKSNIRVSCPTLADHTRDRDSIRPGGTSQRRFRVYWTNYKEKNSLEVVIDAKFNTPPKCDDYYAIRQKVILAISDAAKKNDIDFSYVAQSSAASPLLD